MNRKKLRQVLKSRLPVLDIMLISIREAEEKLLAWYFGI